MSTTENDTTIAKTGISGLDEILRGGLARKQVYLIEGEPGSGKTTLALQFALEGARLGERTLYITLSETCHDLRLAAESHGWNFDGIECMELLLAGDLGEQESAAMMYHPSEIELGVTLKRIRAAVEQTSPNRVVVDSLTEIRLQAQTTLRYRREVLALRQFLRQQNCTVLLLDEMREELTAQSIVHGIIRMYRDSPDFGPGRRRVQVAKFRGVKFWDGCHDCVIESGGIQVFPRLAPAEHLVKHCRQDVSSGLAGLDSLLGGGLTTGSTTLLVGPAGSGKSSAAAQFVFHNLKQGEKATIYTFDEVVENYLTRSAGLGMDLQSFITNGQLRVQQIDPGEFSPGQFAHIVRYAVETEKVRVLVIDSLNGYLNAMPNGQFLIVQLHEIATYLNQKSVLTLFVMSQTGAIATTESPLDMSYLADNVILFRLFEAAGEVRHAISVVKKRTGSHERTIREFELSSTGIQIGKPLCEFQGVLSGVPQFVGQRAELIGQGK